MSEEITIVQNRSSTDLTFSTSRKGTDVVLSTDLLTASLGGRAHACFLSKSRSSGKYYFEMKLVSFEGNQQYSPVLGLVSEQAGVVAPWLVDTGEVLHYSIPPGDIISIFKNNQRSTYPIKWNQGNIVGYAIDLDAKTMKLHTNGVYGPIVPFGQVTSVNTFYPIASSSDAQTGAQSIVQIQNNPKYCPAGYSLW